MERRNNLLFLVLLATVGVLVAAILLGGSGDPGEPVLQTTSSQGDAAAGDVSARTAERAAETEGQPEVGDRQEIEAVPAAASGPIVLSGRLVDAASRPEVGVLVRHREERRRGDGVFFVVDSQDEGGEGGVRTDAEGRFAIEVERDRAGELTMPRSEERLFGATSKRSLPVEAVSESTDLGDLTVTAACAIAGRVVDEAGQPIEGAKVMSLASGSDARSVFPMLFGPNRSVEVGSDGAFVLAGLEPGEVAFGAEAKGFVPVTQRVEVRAAERRDDVVVTLVRGASIAGTVVDDRGLPIAGAKVGVERMRELAPGFQIQGVDDGSQVETDANGYFMVSGVEGPKVSLVAEAKGHVQQSRGDIELGEGSVVFRLDRLGRITGVLLDTEGQPIAGSTVSLTGRPFAPAHTDAEGRFELEDVEPGSVSLSAEGKGHVPVEGYTVHVVAGATVANVTLRAETGAVLVATVVDAKGQPVAGAQVRVSSVGEPGGAVEFGGGGRMIRRARAVSVGLGGAEAVPMPFFGTESELRREKTGPDGVARIAGLPTGPVRVTASGRTDAPSRAVDLQIPRRGTVDTILSLRPAGSVVVRVVDPAGEPIEGARFTLRGPENAPDAERETRSGKTGSEGTATVGQLLEGRYSAVLELDAKPVALGGGGGAFQFVIGDAMGGDSLESTRRPFQVIAGAAAEVLLQKPVLTRFHGVVLAADGPAADVRVTLRVPSELPMLGGGGGGGSATTAADGSFVIEDVAAGSYRLEWGRESQMIRHREEIEIPAGVSDVRKDLEMPVGIVEVTALDQDGAPVAGATITLSRIEAGGETVREARVAIGMSMGGPGGGGGMRSFSFGTGRPEIKTDAQGRARIEDVPPGEYRMKIESDGHAEQEVESVVVAAGVTVDAGVVTLTAAGVVEGTVTGLPAGGGGLPGNLALVEIRRAGAEDDRRPPTMAQDGKFRIDGLPAGDYEVRARSIGLGGDSEAGPWQPVRVEAGRPTNVTVPAGSR